FRNKRPPALTLALNVYKNYLLPEIPTSFDQFDGEASLSSHYKLYLDALSSLYRLFLHLLRVHQNIVRPFLCTIVNPSKKYKPEEVPFQFEPILGVFIAKQQTNTKDTPVWALLDTGSDRSWIGSRLVSQMALQTYEVSREGKRHRAVKAS